LAIKASKREQERWKEKKKDRKEEVNTNADTIHVFLVFLHASKVLIFFKNNLKIPKNILTVKSNSI
jgi:hypothetical protein